MKKISAFAVFLGLLFLAQSACAGAWVQPKGQGFASLQFLHYSTKTYWDRNGDSRDLDKRFTKWEFNPYFEYGLTDDYTLLVNTFWNSLDDGVSTSSGLTDAEIGLRKRLWQDDNDVLSIEGLLLAPLGYDISDRPRLGFGRFGAQVWMLYGHSFKLAERNGFIDTGLGLRSYLGYPSDQIRGRVTLGYDITQRIQGIFETNLEYGLNNGDRGDLGLVTNNPNYRLVKMSLSGRYRITPTYSVVLSGFRHVWGQETGAGGGASTALWINFQSPCENTRNGARLPLITDRRIQIKHDHPLPHRRHPH